MDYLKIGKATELEGNDKKLYRYLEIFPGFLSWATLLLLLFFSYLQPTWVAYFLIAFDVYWLLLVLYLAVLLFAAYKKLKENSKIDWRQKCLELEKNLELAEESECLAKKGVIWRDVKHLIILPAYSESVDVLSEVFEGLLNDGFPLENMIVVLTIEGRTGEEGLERAKEIERRFGKKFGRFLLTVHPDNIPGELKGKSSNQAWGAKEVRKEIIDKEKINYDNLLVSILDCDTVVMPGYFSCLTYKFLTVKNPYHASYQPVPVYHNNIWEARFFARVAASSNTFWQMMQQIRQEKLATYSSHSMTWRALTEIDFWSTTMVSEDSRIFWHCLLYYQGDYRVEPMYFPVSMDVTMDETAWQTAKNLYKQQRRWGWGVENIPYLVFNTIKRWKILPKKQMIGKIFIQVYGFHSWATNALIIGVIGWMPLILGGNRFNNTVLSGNLPSITRTLMTIAMLGLVISAVMSTALLPPKPQKYSIFRYLTMFLQWIILPVSIIVFGAFPALDSQTRLMLGKYMGFWHTPKKYSREM
ncbi:MAG: glycosyltransferase family 2 protein [Patescibacteria group bacterium]|nr:glycosyltransferase family 2 protein [Patescibacteria group bacterium]MDD4610849.1 glycosyltransferase family 2 protein [Patescibacteria group bacterium]